MATASLLPKPAAMHFSNGFGLETRMVAGHPPTASRPTLIGRSGIDDRPSIENF
jgi:hypothetical protein